VLRFQPAARAWENMLLAMCGARFIGYGIGMFAAARAPRRHRIWIDTMIAIQAVDLITQAVYAATGLVEIRQVVPIVALPLLWVVLLSWTPPRLSPCPRSDSNRLLADFKNGRRFLSVRGRALRARWARYPARTPDATEPHSNRCRTAAVCGPDRNRRRSWYLSCPTGTPTRRFPMPIRA
jgi:hypothetical protein